MVFGYIWIWCGSGWMGMGGVGWCDCDVLLGEVAIYVVVLVLGCDVLYLCTIWSVGSVGMIWFGMVWFGSVQFGSVRYFDMW